MNFSVNSLKPHWVLFNESILVSLWTFLPTLKTLIGSYALRVSWSVYELLCQPIWTTFGPIPRGQSMNFSSNSHEPHWVIFHESILVSLWTFLPTLCRIPAPTRTISKFVTQHEYKTTICFKIQKFIATFPIAIIPLNIQTSILLFVVLITTFRPMLSSAFFRLLFWRCRLLITTTLNDHAENKRISNVILVGDHQEDVNSTHGTWLHYKCEIK